jgi:hypothetical protein
MLDLLERPLIVPAVAESPVLRSLYALRKWLSEPEHWITNVWGQDRFGCPFSSLQLRECGLAVRNNAPMVFRSDLHATCLVGGVLFTAESHLVEQEMLMALQQTLQSMNTSVASITYYNDHATHTEVLALIDATIARLCDA